jgi:hypothetical protein
MMSEALLSLSEIAIVFSGSLYYRTRRTDKFPDFWCVWIAEAVDTHIDTS